MLQNQDLLMSAISRFYADPKNMAKILPIIQGSSPTPLRLFNWFVTNHARDNNVVIRRTLPVGESYVNVHLSYRTQLKSFSKAQFDPFRRDENRRIIFKFDDTDPEGTVETTVGQLNFFRWAIESGIVDHVTRNREALEALMRAPAAQAAQAPARAASRECTPPDARNMQTRNCTTVVTFD